ncbi:MAG TPA: glycosyltransferase family 4 protein [Acidisarcina sp.]
MTSVHYPFDTRIFHKECISLAMAGYDVTLIAPHAEGDVTRGGVKLRAVTPPRNRNERIKQTVPAVYRAAAEADAEIYHFHDAELMPIGAMLRMRGKKVIYDVHEDNPGSVFSKKWIPDPLKKPASLAMAACEAGFGTAWNHVIAATPKIAGKFAKGRTSVVQNFPWKTELVLAEGIPYEQRENVVAYVGWLGDLRGLREMRQALELAVQEVRVRLIVGGAVKPGAKADYLGGNTEDGLIEYLGYVKRPEVAQLLGRARAGILLLHPTFNYLPSQPTKLFEYMAAGLPVIMSDFPYIRSVVQDANCGILVDPLNPVESANAIVWIMQHPAEAAEMGRRGQRAVAEHYNWEHEAEGLIATYKQVRAART